MVLRDAFLELSWTMRTTAGCTDRNRSPYSSSMTSTRSTSPARTAASGSAGGSWTTTPRSSSQAIRLGACSRPATGVSRGSSELNVRASVVNMTAIISGMIRG